MGASQGKERPQHQSTPTGAKVATAKPVAAQQTISGQCTHECSYAPRLQRCCITYFLLEPVDCVIIGAPQDDAICTILKGELVYTL